MFTASDNSAPALNFTTFLAGTLITAPVRGLRASLASFLATDQEPNPTTATLSPFFRAFSTLEKNASTAFLESVFVSPDPAAIASINYDLFI